MRPPKEGKTGSSVYTIYEAKGKGSLFSGLRARLKRTSEIISEVKLM
jgi:hypothetical protein